MTTASMFCAVVYGVFVVYLLATAFWLPGRTVYAVASRRWSRDRSEVAAACAILTFSPIVVSLILVCLGQASDFRLRFAVAMMLTSVTAMIQIASCGLRRITPKRRYCQQQQQQQQQQRMESYE